MNLDQSRIRFRERNAWEGMDVGLCLFAERKWTYMGVWLCLSLPLWLLLAAVLWRSPLWAGVLMWWLKPVFEAPILALLARQYFVPLPGFRACLHLAWAALWRKRLLGDVSWRRLGMTRSLILPIAVLEALDGAEFASRRNELSRYAGSVCSWLTFLGIHLEMILTYGVLVLLFWLWYGNPVQDALIQPAQMGQLVKSAGQALSLLFNGQALWLDRSYNLAYALILALWGPVYVGAGFGAYLNARTQAEAWDVRLRFRQLAKRLGHMAWLWSVLLVCMVGMMPNPAVAEPLPNASIVRQQRQAVFNQPPFPTIETKNRYCWRSCEQSHLRLPVPSGASWHPSALFNGLLWVAVALLMAGVLLLLRRWWGQNGRQQASMRAPEKLPATVFGLDLSAETLPRDVVGQARTLWAQQPRDAVALLYRASLRALHEDDLLSLSDSDTEQEVLARVHGLHQPPLADYWQTLTLLWIQIAYAHRLPTGRQVDFDALCNQYSVLLKQRPSS